MLRLLARSVRDFRANYKKLLIFEYLFMLLTSFAVIPVITFIFNRIVMVLGSGSLLNNEVYRIGLSYTGVVGLLAIGVVASFVLFIEFGVIIVLDQKHYFGKQVFISDAAATVLRQTPRLLGFGLVQLLLFMLILIPFIDSPLSESFYALFNLPILINSQVLGASQSMMVVYALLLLAAIYTLLRWIFVLHFIILDGRRISEAIKCSLALTRGKRFKLFLSLFSLNAAVFGIGSLLISSLSYLPAWLNMNVLGAFTEHQSLTLSTLLTYMFALLLVPINLIFLTRLYYYYGRLSGTTVHEDQLTLHRSLLSGLEKYMADFLEGRKRKTIMYATIAVVYMGLALFVSFAANDNLVYAKWNVLVSAHRGDMEEAPENSLPAVQNAIRKGIPSVEIDVQLTRDGVVVLHHDYNLKRMAGTAERVGDLTYEELLQLSIGSVETEEGVMEEVRIPMLAEVLAEAKDNVKLLIDLKPLGPGEALAKEVVSLVELFEMERDVYIQAFDKGSLQVIRELNPEIRIGQILYFALGNLASLDVDFYTIEQVMLTKQLVDEAHRHGREVWVWTVNSSRNMKEVLKFQIDGIITDYPARARAMVELNL